MFKGDPFFLKRTVIQGFIDVNPDDFFHFNTDPRTRGHNKYKTKIYLTLRNRCDFPVPFYRTTIEQRRLHVDYRLAIEWNKLPTDIKSINKNKSFKHRLKLYLLDYAFL